MANASRALDEVKGGVVDLYYSDPKNSLKQNISVEYDTRFTVAFQSLSGGQQVITIPPGAGIRDVLLVMQFTKDQLAPLNTPTVVGSAFGSAVLPQGWGYNLVDNVSWRIGKKSNCLCVC